MDRTLRPARERLAGYVVSIPAGLLFAGLALLTPYRPEVMAIFAVGFLMHPLLEFSIISHVSRVIERDAGRIANVAESYERDWKPVIDDVKAIKEWRTTVVDPAIRKLESQRRE